MIKNIKKVMKKMPKKIITIVLVLAIALNCISPLSKVFADNEYSYVVTFTIASNTETEHTLTLGNNGKEIGIDDQFVSIKDANDDQVTIGTAACPSETTCTITVTDGPAGKLSYNSENKFTLFMQGHEFSMGHTFMGNEDIAVQDYVPHEEWVEPGPEPGEGHFDGKAYVLWSCGTGTCYHYFDNIPDFNDGMSTFYKDTEVTADNDPSKHFDVHAELKAWALPDRFDFWVEIYKQRNNIGENEEIDWTHVDPEDIIAEYPPDMRPYEEAAHAAYQNDPSTGCAPVNYDQILPEDERHAAEDAHQACIDEYYIADGNLPFIKLQPVGEPSDNNAYVSYGDRNFKVVIYNNQFKGITTGNLEGLNYYPTRWTNPFLRTDQYDISATTKNKPTGLDSILLETTVNIEALPYNDFEITSIEPLDVPDDAVTITKDGDTWKVEFSSHFYDNVVFKVNNEFYIQIKRYTIDGYIAHIDNEPVILADFYYERAKSYTDFIITAKILHKDGTTRTVTLEPKAGVDDGLGNFTSGYVMDQEHPNPDNPLGVETGKGLNLSTFKCDLLEGEEEEIQDIYLNAEYTGSTITNYAGAYSGSGEGTLANIYHPDEEGE